MMGIENGAFNKEQIDEIVSQVLIRLAERIIADAPPRRVLMLFCGAGSGYTAGMQAIRLLSAAGHPLTVALSPAARYLITEEKVRQAGAANVLPDGWVNAPALVSESELVLVPTLSMNTAARLALGLMDSLVNTLVLGALLAGKPVLAVCDGANPYGHGGEVFGGDGSAAPALRARMSQNLMTLVDYGVELVGEGEFLLRLARRLQPTPPPPVQETAPDGGANGQQRTLQAGVVTAGDLQGLPYGGVLRLPAGARLTPLAQDQARSLSLRLVYAGE